MDEITKITELALSRYFKLLSQFGYRPYNSVDNLIVLLFIEELFNVFSPFITEEDYNTIIKVMYKLAKEECMIDFIIHSEYDELIHKNNTELNTRITEDSILRIGEDNLIRVEV